MKVLSLCDGLSGGLLAFKKLGVAVDYYAVEIDNHARKLADSNLPEIKRPFNDVNDVTEDWVKDNGPWDWVIFGSPCFVRGTKVLTSMGYVPIEDIKIGDLVLTHRGRFRKVLDTGHKVAPIRKLKFKGMKEILTTDEHPFLCRETTRTYNTSTRGYDRNFSEEKWLEAKDIVPLKAMGKMAHIADTSDMDLDPTTCWLIGRFLADGHLVHRNRTESGREKDFIYQIVLSVGERKLQNVLDNLRSLKKSYRKHSPSTYRVTVHSKKLVTLFRELGIKNGASTKDLPVKILQLPTHLLKIVLDGYLSGDGHKDKYGFWCANSVSEDLMLGMQIAAAKVYGVGAGYSFFERPKTTVIEGRTVNQKDTHLIRFPEDTSRSQSRKIEGGIYVTCKVNSPIGELAEVFNLEVEEDNTYTANNVVVHNCQSVSVAGKGEGLNGSSGLLIQCLKILRWAQKYNPGCHYLIENVKMKKEFKQQFDDLIGGGSVLINSALVSAQNRERYYWTNFPVSQPQDKGLVIADILEDPSEETDNCILSEKMVAWLRSGIGSFAGKFERTVETTSKKANCLTARYFKLGRQDQYIQCFKYSESNRYHNADGTPTQKASELLYRKLTVRECARLQTVPEWYSFDVVSKTQAYKAIGNGFTVEVIAHILSHEIFTKD